MRQASRTSRPAAPWAAKRTRSANAFGDSAWQECARGRSSIHPVVVSLTMLHNGLRNVNDVAGSKSCRGFGGHLFRDFKAKSACCSLNEVKSLPASPGCIMIWIFSCLVAFERPARAPRAFVLAKDFFTGGPWSVEHQHADPPSA